MFTGLVAETGEVRKAGTRLAVSTPLASELARGDSIAVAGVCLTAVEIADNGFEADLMEETLERSRLGELREGDRVNLELPLRAGDRMGGHYVQGHVDGTGVVDQVEQREHSRLVRVKAPPELLRYVVDKGSIAVEGVSLTVTEVDGQSFAVSLIPETLERTTLGAVAPGDPVNLEVDMMLKRAEMT